ncbi:hypothetical protein [Rivihabitans pingtungensis]|jgi:hypothetical protein|uniref:hypothetical protein n=1 Tax=Rivihabitans pingtungensis TaxID=1054498 RepID=UPI002356D25D|nr:hypothetical protein [Rivihabitans pingtungensis]MCK6435868.1 hypothetical protein [Rivihabitans pingtungensis]
MTVFLLSCSAKFSAAEHRFSFTKMRHFFIAAAHTARFFYGLIPYTKLYESLQNRGENTRFGWYPVVAIHHNRAQADTAALAIFALLQGKTGITGMSPVLGQFEYILG